MQQISWIFQSKQLLFWRTGNIWEDYTLPVKLCAYTGHIWLNHLPTCKSLEWSSYVGIKGNFVLIKSGANGLLNTV